MRLIDADRLLDSLRGNALVDVAPELEKAIREQPTVPLWPRHPKKCPICSRYTKNRKEYLVPSNGLVGAVCNYCKQHGRLKRERCVPVARDEGYVVYPTDPEWLQRRWRGEG